MRTVPLLATALLLAAGCTCTSDGDCPLDEQCSDGRCVSVGGGGGAGNLELAPASATVHTSAGEPTPAAAFELKNDGTATLSFNISCDTGLPAPANGLLAVNATASISLPLPSYRSAGARTVTCTATTPDGAGGPRTFTATIEVGPDVTPPTASLTSPGAGVVSGAVALSASATDAIGVVSVDFAVDGAVVATASGAPYGVTWASGSVWNGPHSLTAIARDAAGNAGVSAAVSVSVANYPGAALSVHTSMGIPDAATADPANRDRFLSVKHQYALSYDGARRVPNWVSWELNASWLGAVARQNDFRIDDTLPAGFPQAQLSDYLNSGWDRGHMCPSEDRTATLLDNENTFYLTNMLPQADNVNGGPWAQLEAYARSLAVSGKEIFEVSGGIYGLPAKTIGADAVAVPSSVFKLVVVLDAPGQGAANVTTSTRVISVIMPNDNATVSRSADWRGFRVKASEIESQTGLRLLSDVSEPVREALESQVDSAP